MVVAGPPGEGFRQAALEFQKQYPEIAMEFVAGRRKLAAKVRRYRPKALAFLGVGAYCHAFSLKKTKTGRQEEHFEGARVWVLPNPSGLNANYQLPALIKLFRQLWQQSSKSPSSARSRSTASPTC